ncbi:MAG: winged helix-turn-helix transcriptional regulator [Holophagaceae bacterium]|nr:winged helix-turn-helix transcriptional regulator [Holophagaceae bacterium]
MGKTPLSPELMMRVAERFRLLGDAQRLGLLQALRGGERSLELSVGELAERTGTSIPNASKHLKQLCQAGMILRRQEGTTVYYAIADPSVFELCEVVCGGLERAAHAEVKLHRRR